MKKSWFRGCAILCKRVFAAAVAVVLFSGCSSSHKDTVIPVSGTITVNGQPLQHGTVVFHPDAEKGNQDRREARGVISPDKPGVYRLSTEGKDGVAAGWYTVTVHAMKPMKGMGPTEWLADQRYTDEKTSGLSVEVVKNAQTGAYDFKLDPPK